ncbi:MAG: hypothetical protein IT314_08400 [Anaerolineales bacterium]|nr:hypothetical protein [Anaerolineales bacterium]
MDGSSFTVVVIIAILMVVLFVAIMEKGKNKSRHRGSDHSSFSGDRESSSNLDGGSGNWGGRDISHDGGGSDWGDSGSSGDGGGDGGGGDGGGGDGGGSE